MSIDLSLQFYVGLLIGSIVAIWCCWVNSNRP